MISTKFNIMGITFGPVVPPGPTPNPDSDFTFTLDEANDGYIVAGADNMRGIPRGYVVVPKTYNGKNVIATKAGLGRPGDPPEMQGAFTGNRYITSIKFQPNLLSCNKGTFTEMKHLLSIYFPNTIRYIDREIFGQGRPIKSFEIHIDKPMSEVSAMSNYPWKIDINKDSIYCSDGELPVKITDGKLRYFPIENDSAWEVAGLDNAQGIPSGDLIIPETFQNKPVKRFKSSNNYWPFANNEKLSGTVTLPSTWTTSGGEQAFRDSYVSNVVFPSSVTKIDDSYFWNNQSLKTFNIPSTVKTLENSIFFGCSKLISCEIPETVTSLGPTLFEACDNLIHAKLPSWVTTIGHACFSGCGKLSAFELPPNVQKFDTDAFMNTGFVTFHVPSTVNSIAETSFRNCNKLTDIYFDGKTKQQVANMTNGNGIWFGLDLSKTKIHCSDGIIQAESDDTWIYIPFTLNTLKIKIKDPNTIKEMTGTLTLPTQYNGKPIVQCDTDFDNTKLTKIVVPEGYIINPRIRNNTQLTEVVYPSTFKDLNWFSMRGNTILSRINWNTSVEVVKAFITPTYKQLNLNFSVTTIYCTNGEITS